MTHTAWWKIAVTALAATSTYYLRFALSALNVQGLTFLLPVLFAAYFFGSTMGALAAALSLATAHFVLWTENPALLFSRPYLSGIFNFLFFSTLIVLYAWRHEQVLWRLDASLAREKAAREKAEEANRLKDQFLATLSHELRTPINVILGYLQILRTSPTDNPQRALEIVQRNAEQQARLIEDVLDASRIASGRLQLAVRELAPMEVLLEAVESLQPAIAAKRLHLTIDPADRGTTIAADPHRLRQVFWNILSNAVKFTPDEGRILVRSRTAHGYVEIAVEDNGRGIRRDFLPHVFEMFRQADPSPTRETAGIGLGLSLVKRFVELQGGEVSVQSPGEGLGTTVTCRFPMRRMEGTAPQPAGERGAQLQTS